MINFNNVFFFSQKFHEQALSEASQTQEIQDLSERVKIWLKELSLFKESYLDLAQTSDKFLEGDSLSDPVLPMRLAAKRAVSRYEGLLTPVGPRERLFRKLLTWIGFISPGYETPFQLANDSNASEPYLRCVSSLCHSSFSLNHVMVFGCWA